MRRHVAQRSKVDFFRLEFCAENFLDGKYDGHEMCTLFFAEVGHFTHVLPPNYAAKTCVVGIVHQHDAAVRILPKQFTADGFT